jgi:hypothetical protein
MYRIEVLLNGITSLPNFMTIYQAIQKISIDPLCLKAGVPLGRVCPAVNNFLTIVASAKDGM